MSRWNVADVMTVGAVSVGLDTPFKEIVDILEAHGINAAPVIDGTRQVVGVVSSADLVPKIEFAGEDDELYVFEAARIRRARGKAAGTTAAELMTTPAITVLPQTPVPQAARIMDESGLKRLPVVDARGGLVGMVTRRDLLKVFLRGDTAIHREIVQEILPDITGLAPDEIKVEVDDGVVTLLGELRRASVIPMVIRHLERVDGVIDVVSYLTVEDDSDRQGAPWPPYD